MPYTRATRAKQSAAMKAKWADPEYRARCIEARRQADVRMVEGWKAAAAERERLKKELDELL